MNERQIRKYQQQAITKAVWDARQIEASPDLFVWLEPDIRVGLTVNK